MMQIDKSITIHDLLNLQNENEAVRITVLYPYAKTHEHWVGLIEDALKHILIEFSKTRQERADRSEDGLTVDIITALRFMGMNANHDIKYGGHCDIVIERREFMWLGEAKIHRDYEWLLKGFMQLSTRYSTGLPGQDVGGMIIYCKNANIKSVMDKWRKHLSDNVPSIKIEDCDDNPLVFYSRHDHQVSGLPYKVKHLPMALYFAPQDK